MALWVLGRVCGRTEGGLDVGWAYCCLACRLSAVVVIPEISRRSRCADRPPRCMWQRSIDAPPALSRKAIAAGKLPKPGQGPGAAQVHVALAFDRN